MSVAPIALVAPSITPLAGIAGAGDASSGRDVSGSSGIDFAAQVSKSLEALQAGQDKADDLAVKAATGSLTDVHDFMIASTEAGLATQLTAAVRNKAIEAFNEIMRMQA